MSILEALQQKNKEIERLKKENQELLNEYQKLDDKYYHCLQIGAEQKKEIDRLQNIINTTPTPPTVQELRNLERQL